MTFNIEGQLLETILDTLAAATKALEKVTDREKELLKTAEDRRLLSESEAELYLKRDTKTLLYYRRNGLPYYKFGHDVWYTKGDIDKWIDSGKVNRHSR